jgi:hypothetical protein
LPQDDPKQRQPDITKAKEILGWEPKVGRAEGLKITYDYFKSYQKKLNKKNTDILINYEIVMSIILHIQLLL